MTHPEASASLVRTIRIFISSPGDVAEERDRARLVIDGLRRRYAGRLVLKPVLWEDLPLQGDISFQEGIDRVLSGDTGVDVAVFILWSRLGSALGAGLRKQDGSKYRSGTEREFDLMMKARQRSGGNRPALLVYTRRDEPTFEENLRGRPTEQKRELLVQKEMVEQFIQEEFHDAEGHNVRAYHSFDRPQCFSQRLRVHLQEILDREVERAGLEEAVWDIETQGAPYVGLAPFEREQAAVFFGRDTEVLEARRALADAARRGAAFLLISGASGSGKSSLARAGVVPAVVEHEVDESLAEWRSVAVTPSELGQDLVVGLVNRIAGVLPELRAEGNDLGAMVRGLKNGPADMVQTALGRALSDAARGRKGGVRLLVFVDQFEEVFALPGLDGEGRAQWLRVLRALARSGFAWVVATLRSDFMGEFQKEPILAELSVEGAVFPVLAPEVDALRRIIEGPARLAGLMFEVRDGQPLGDRILGDVAHRAELLPLLGNLLRDLYERRTEDGVLGWEVYKSLGGVEGALMRKDAEVFGALPKSSQRAVEELWPMLVSLNPAGEGTETRVWASMAELRGTELRGGVVDALVTARFLTTGVKDGEPVVALAHDSLLHLWHRPRRWLAANQGFLRERAYLRTDIDRWRVSGYRKDHLLPAGHLLKRARILLREYGRQLGAEEIRYIRDSVSAARRRGVFQKVLYSFLVAGGIVGGLVGLCILGFYFLTQMFDVPRGYIIDIWIKGLGALIRYEIVSDGRAYEAAELQEILLKARKYPVSHEARNLVEPGIYNAYLERVSELPGGFIPVELIEEGPAFFEYVRNYGLHEEAAEGYGRLARMAIAQGSWDLARRCVDQGLKSALQAIKKSSEAECDWMLRAAQEWFAAEASKNDEERDQKVENLRVFLQQVRTKDGGLLLACEDQWLSLPEASEADFSGAAYRAAHGGSGERAKVLLDKGATRFSEDPNLARNAGWVFVNLEDPVAALAAFQKSRALLKPGEAPGSDLLVGLSLALWLNQREDEAVASYLELIIEGRRQKKLQDWADASVISAQKWPERESKPLEALRSRVLERHPEVGRSAH
jgi:hypothetical protein